MIWDARMHVSLSHAPEDVDGHVEAAGAQERLHHPVQPLPVHHAAL
jgi:hypothetical protein